MLKVFDFAVLIAAVAVFVAGVRHVTAGLRLGAPDEKDDYSGSRIKDCLLEILGHARIRKEPQGLYHFWLLWAFIIPLGVILLAQLCFTLPAFIAGPLKLFVEIAAALGFYGLLRLVVRRYLARPEQLDTKPEDNWALLLLGMVFLTGFLTAGARVALSSHSALWSPAALLFSLPLRVFSPDALADLMAFVWRFHLYLVIAALATLPYGKMGHAVFGAMNIYFRPHGPKGAFPKLDLENSEVFGVGSVELFTKRQLLGLEACVRCGRCQSRCPAYNTGKPLNPKKVIQDLKTHFHAKAPLLAQGKGDDFKGAMIDGGGVLSDELWSCTTCRHCVEVCPMRIEHVRAMVDMRRHLVLMEGQMPDELVSLNKNLENNFNPWGVGWSARNDWMERRGVKPRILTEEDPSLEILLWIGCAGAFDDRYQRVVASLVRLLEKANVSFGVLGVPEKCCGEPARSTGNEYLYQMLATENIETMNSLGVKKIVTPCPHCLKTLSGEYPQFGGNYEVVHHSVFLAELMRSGRLGGGKAALDSVTFHDSCYLSRYAGITGQPREILSGVVSGKIIEMPRCGEENFCCGAGGGRMWMEEHGTRINQVRTEEALATGAAAVATACPFCLTMLLDGVKAAKKEEEVQVLDVAEALERSLS